MSQLFTCHNIWTVVSCTKLWCDLTITIKIRTNRILKQTPTIMGSCTFYEIVACCLIVYCLMSAGQPWVGTLQLLKNTGQLQYNNFLQITRNSYLVSYVNSDIHFLNCFTCLVILFLWYFLVVSVFGPLAAGMVQTIGERIIGTWCE